MSSSPKLSLIHVPRSLTHSVSTTYERLGCQSKRSEQASTRQQCVTHRLLPQHLPRKIYEETSARLYRHPARTIPTIFPVYTSDFHYPTHRTAPPRILALSPVVVAWSAVPSANSPPPPAQGAIPLLGGCKHSKAWAQTSYTREVSTKVQGHPYCTGNHLWIFVYKSYCLLSLIVNKKKPATRARLLVTGSKLRLYERRKKERKPFNFLSFQTLLIK